MTANIATSSEPANDSVDESSSTIAATWKVDSLASGIAMLLSLSMVQRVAGLVRNILFCRLLEPEELGRWNLAFSLLLLAAPLAVLGLPGSFGRYVERYRQQGQLRVFLRRTTTATIVCAVASVIIMCLLAPWGAWLIFGSRDAMALMTTVSLGLLTIITFNFLIELLTALRQVRFVSYMLLLNSLLFASIALTLIGIFDLGAIGAVIGYSAACAITGLMGITFLTRVWRRLESVTVAVPHSKLWRQLLPFAGWVWIANLLSNLFTAADRYMIIHFSKLSPSEATALVGQYHSSLVIPELILMVGAMLASVTLPYLSDDWESNNRPRVSQRIGVTIKAYCIVMCVGAVFVMLLAPWIFEWVLGGKYGAGRAVLPWTLAYCTWAGMALIAQNYLWCSEKARWGTLALAVGLAINLACNYFLVPRWGLMGAVSATAAANGVVLAGIYAFSAQQGMTVRRDLLLVSLLPLSLVGGPLLATAILLGCGLLTFKSPLLLTSDDRKWIVEQISPRLTPLRQSVPAWLWPATMQHSKTQVLESSS